MKILLLTHKDPSLIGGGEQMVRLMAQCLKADIGCCTRGRWKDTSYLIDSARFSLLRDSLWEDYDIIIGIDDIAARADPDYVYLTTPRRAFYDMLFSQPIHKRVISSFLRTLDQRVMRRQNIVSISNIVASRVYKYYDKYSDVIYPPINTAIYSWKEPEDYWLSVQRIDKWKRIDLQLETFKLLPDERLKIVGGGDPSLIPELPKNVEYIGEVKENELVDLYSHCRGVLCTSIDEDFGYVPIEAMASGKYVVAVAEGGYLETIWNRKIGITASAHPKNLAYAISDMIKSHDKDVSIITSRSFGMDSFTNHWNILFSRFS